MALPEIGSDADGWIQWGGECPVSAKTFVDVKLRNGERATDAAGRLYWAHDGDASDIIAYRLARPVDESASPFENGIGDVSSAEKGSGARYNGGKLNYALLPLCTLEDEVKVWMYGEKKYATFNWAKGMPWSAPLASLLRHMAAWQRGEETDPESGLPHLAHAMCNLRMLTLYSKTYREGDDRPKEWLK